MFKAAAASATTCVRPRPLLALSARALSISPRRHQDSTRSHARTDPGISVRPADTASHSSTRPLRTKPTLSCFSLDGKTAVVTGGARGLGYVMTQALLESGANVAIVDLNGDAASEAAQSLAAWCKEQHSDDGEIPRITSHSADVANPDAVHAAIQDILNCHDDKIDILVTSAGFCENRKAEEYPHDRLQKMWDVNINGTYLCAAEVARHMMKRKAGGSMVFIGSMSGAIVNVPQPQAPYNASKAAVRHLASSFAVEWAPHGIRVNCISPGYMLTDLTKKILEERPDLKEKWNSLIPQGKMGDPEDLKGAVVFLASDASGYVTGAELRVDGGYTIT